MPVMSAESGSPRSDHSGTTKSCTRPPKPIPVQFAPKRSSKSSKCQSTWSPTPRNNPSPVTSVRPDSSESRPFVIISATTRIRRPSSAISATSGSTISAQESFTAKRFTKGWTPSDVTSVGPASGGRTASSST
uniref:(northern house mosquito) hypothetical protein n=1 Tax=Culex pipiens TaxID=7175 RepID=A0A8D8DFL8_CULPI